MSGIYDLPKTRAEAKAAGSMFYFTGVPCKNGHIDKRYSNAGSCRSCWGVGLKPKKAAVTAEQKALSQKIRSRKWYEKNRNRVIQAAADWKRENKDKVREYESRWRKKPKSKAITFMRDSLRRVLCIEKNGRTEVILGYTRLELVEHIEKQFTGNMSWENYGRVWEIDHITPVSKMLDDGISDPAIINCLTNLRPLSKKKNRDKSDKVETLL